MIIIERANQPGRQTNEQAKGRILSPAQLMRSSCAEPADALCTGAEPSLILGSSAGRSLPTLPDRMCCGLIAPCKNANVLQFVRSQFDKNVSVIYNFRFGLRMVHSNSCEYQVVKINFLDVAISCL